MLKSFGCRPLLESLNNLSAYYPGAIMKRLKAASWIAFVGGCLAIFQGIKHFPMAFEMAKYHEYANLSKPASDLLILLWFCTGLMLLTFGVLSLYFSRKLRIRDHSARIFFLCGGIAYLLRTLFELIYPVAIPEPNNFVLAAVFTGSLLFLIPVALTLQAK